MNANGNTITSFARELNPTGVGEHIDIYMTMCKKQETTQTGVNIYMYKKRYFLTSWPSWLRL